ncbi:MAG: SurA N-terminal domain-containing protein [Gemmatimonadetes bacterium]|nr:SurA N-terminal domain-containing protein [Gemmatimonadota bacterium]
MIRTMRSSAKWIMGVLVVAFVGWMVFDVGMGITGGGSYRPGDAIAKVNGKGIDLQTFNDALRNAQERQRLQSGSAPLTREGQQALEDAVLENLVQEILLREEFSRRGITVSDEEIVAAAQNSPPPEIISTPEFQTEGQFDLAKYQRFIASRSDPSFLLALEARYREEIPRAKLFDQLVADVYLSDAKLWQAYRDQHDSATIRLLALYPDAAVPDSAVLVTQRELELYYNDHREEFNRRAVAYLSYVAVPRVPNAADTAAARARAVALRREILQGADFAEVAQRESADSVSGARGGDLGEVTKPTFVSEFEQAALALRPGQLSEPVLSPFGYHVIKLESKSGDRYHARHILVPIELVGAHLDEVDARIDSLDRRAAEQVDGAELDSAAAGIGARVEVAAPVREGERVQAGPEAVPDAGLWAFEARPGETSPVIETERASYVFRLDSLIPGGTAPLNQIRDVVHRPVVLQKKREATRQLAEQLARDLSTRRTTLEAAAKRYDAPLTTIGPFTRINPVPALQEEPVVVGAAFGVPLDGVSQPIMGQRAVYLVQPIARRLADSTAFVRQLPEQREQALQAARQARVRLVLSSLREQAKVDDRRRALAAAQRAAEEQQEVLQRTQSGIR